MEIIGYIGALAMGISLGLIGGGGSILTVPILVYLFSVEPVLATAYSLFIVGLTSLVGAFSHIKHGNIDWKTAFIFGVPSVISVYLTRMYLVPLIPETLGTVGGLEITKSIFLLMFFAILMVVASYTMIKANANQTVEVEGQAPEYKPLFILFEGIVVGAITGLVGAGGGFLIIPALVIMTKLPMKKAVGTSLIIIAFKSLIGFLGDVRSGESIEWRFLLVFSVVAVFGILMGVQFSKKVSNEKLKPAFGYFVLIMGFYIIAKELFFKHH